MGKIFILMESGGGERRVLIWEGQEETGIEHSMESLWREGMRIVDRVEAGSWREAREAMFL